ncbi:MAG TPA: hypothetical protein PKE31_20595 [Pseudomonadota bacterium]|jgi:hypothetical protein|nr:hypothetical protein [Pseudomonadota bacterium]
MANDSTGKPAVRHFVGDGIELLIDGDLVGYRTVGNMTLADAKLTFEVSRAVAEEYGYVLVLVDSTRKNASISAEARKFQTDTFLKKGILTSHTAVYGVNAMGRAIVTLMVRAARLVVGKELSIEIVADEAAALRALDAARERFRKAGLAKK